MGVYYIVSAVVIVSAGYCWLVVKKIWFALVLFGAAFAVLSLKNIFGTKDEFALVYNLALAAIFIAKGLQLKRQTMKK